MRGIFDPPRPFMKPKPPVYPPWDPPDRDDVKPGYYRMTAEDLRVSLKDSQKTQNFKEYQETIKARLIRNDGTKQSLVWLAMVRNVFHDELIKMPESYITRLVFNNKHFTVILMNNGIVLGGICFLPFKDRDFAEIAFCAVSSSQQVRGYGSYVMACVKTVFQVMGIRNILTYADNSAVNYFKRQGFTLEILLPREKWQRCIKDYHGATLIHCKVNPHVDYLHFHSITDQQKRFISKLLPDYEVHRLSSWPIRSIAGIRIDREAKFEVINQMRLIIILAKLHSKAWPFLEPVNIDEAPKYREMIQKPMDFSRLEQNMNDGKYRTIREFRNDLNLIFSNCYIYNGSDPDNVYTKCAKDLQTYCDKLFEEHVMGHRRNERP